MGKGKCGRPRMEPQEREIQAAIRRAICEEELKRKAKVLQDMAKYRKNHERMASKQAAARAAGLSYGYYVALVLEHRGRLTSGRGRQDEKARTATENICSIQG